MGFWKKLFGHKEAVPAKAHSFEEISAARAEEPQSGYSPVCARIFAWQHTGGEHLDFTRIDDPKLGLSKLDQMILPRLLKAAFHWRQVVCDENCPGYTKVPVEPFPLPDISEGLIMVRCQRMIPEIMLGVDGGWGALRDKAMSFLEKHTIHVESSCDGCSH